MSSELAYTLQFLRDLRMNNTREWFSANKKAYDKARGAFTTLLEDLIARFAVVDTFPDLTPASIMYRINRDVRFSNDKSPYKLNMSAVFGAQGRKTELGRSYYFSVEPDETLVASGVYFPSSAHLKRIREGIAENSAPLRKIIKAKRFTETFGKMEGEQLKSAPKGYDKTHPEIDLLRYKQFMATRYFPDEAVTADDFADQILDTMAAARPFAGYFAAILER